MIRYKHYGIILKCGKHPQEKDLSINADTLTSTMGALYIFLVQVRVGQKYYAPKVWPGKDLNPWPPDRDSSCYVTETNDCSNHAVTGPGT